MSGQRVIFSEHHITELLPIDGIAQDRTLQARSFPRSIVRHELKEPILLFIMLTSGRLLTRVRAIWHHGRYCAVIGVWLQAIAIENRFLAEILRNSDHM